VNAVEFQGVSKSYAIYASPGDRLKELLTAQPPEAPSRFLGAGRYQFSRLKRGETFCIVGQNGSGKSTLLQMVAGILRADARRIVAVNDRVSALLELGAGFNPEFSGRRLTSIRNAPILGLTTRQIDQRIQGYRELRRDRRVYRMQAGKDLLERHGCAAGFCRGDQRGSEILLVDESAGRGRYYFRQRCMRKVHELRRARHHDPVRLARGERCQSHRRPRHVAGWRAAGWKSASRIGVVAKYLAAMVEKDSELPDPQAETEEKVPRRDTGGAGARDRWRRFPTVDHGYGDGAAEIIGDRSNG